MTRCKRVEVVVGMRTVVSYAMRMIELGEMGVWDKGSRVWRLGLMRGDLTGGDGFGVGGRVVGYMGSALERCVLGRVMGMAWGWRVAYTVLAGF